MAKEQDPGKDRDHEVRLRLTKDKDGSFQADAGYSNRRSQGLPRSIKEAEARAAERNQQDRQAPARRGLPRSPEEAKAWAAEKSQPTPAERDQQAPSGPRGLPRSPEEAHQRAAQRQQPAPTGEFVQGGQAQPGGAGPAGSAGSADVRKDYTVFSSASRNFIKGVTQGMRVNSQAGLAAQQGPKNSVPSSPKPGEKGSRFNPVVVERGERSGSKMLPGAQPHAAPAPDMITEVPEHIKNPLPKSGRTEGVSKEAEPQTPKPSLGTGILGGPFSPVGPESRPRAEQAEHDDALPDLPDYHPDYQQGVTAGPPERPSMADAVTRSGKADRSGQESPGLKLRNEHVAPEAPEGPELER